MPNAEDLVTDDALRARTLAGCANSSRDRRVLGEAAHALVAAGRHAEALEIFDIIIEFTDLTLTDYCNALWVAQKDNTHLPIDAARDRRYLAACLPFGRSNPPIFLNAAGVCVEIGEREEAIANLLRAADGKVDLTPYLAEPLFRELTTHPTWAAIAAGTPQPATPVSLLGLAAAAVGRGAWGDAVPALRKAWRASRSPRIAALLDRLGELDGRRVGYGASWIEAALQTSSSELPALVEDTSRSLRDGRGGYGDKNTKNGLWLMGECDDPRYATALLRILAAPPSAKVRKKVEDGWAIALSMLVALGDRRAVEPLAILATRYPGLMPTPMGAWLAGQIARSADALRAQDPPAPLDADDAALCAAIEAAIEAALEAVRPAAPASQPAILAPAAIAPPLPETSTSLLAAIAAFDRGDLVGASESVLSAWRRTRAPRIADVLDLLNARDGAVDIAVVRELALEAWLELAFLNRPGDAPALFCSLREEIEDPEHPENAEAPAERIWALARRDDPRLTTALIVVLEAPRFLLPREDGNGVEEFWDALMDALRALGDARAVEALHALVARVRSLTVEVDQEAALNMYTQRPIGPYLEYQLKLVADQLRSAEVELSADDAAHCAQLETRLAPERTARAAARGAASPTSRRGKASCRRSPTRRQTMRRGWPSPNG